MPMTGRAAKDPKVRFEFGPDGAPPADTARMDLLKAEYKEAGEAVTKLGYHSDMLDVVPRRRRRRRSFRMRRLRSSIL
jgi:sugar phosphate isomerase/epimerase